MNIQKRGVTMAILNNFFMKAVIEITAVDRVIHNVITEYTVVIKKEINSVTGFLTPLINCNDNFMAVVYTVIIYLDKNERPTKEEENALIKKAIEMIKEHNNGN